MYDDIRHQFLIKKIHNKKLTDKYFYKYVNGGWIDSCLSDDEKNKIIQREGSVVCYLKNYYPKVSAWWNWGKEFYDKLALIDFQFYTDGNLIFYKFSAEIAYAAPFSRIEDEGYFGAVVGSRRESFEVLNEFYSRDSENVYYLTMRINVDCDSFSVVSGHFAKDKNGIWSYGFFCLPGINVADFEIIKSYGQTLAYAKDRNQVYVLEYNCSLGNHLGRSSIFISLPNSHSDSFEVLNADWAKDKNNVYCRGKIRKEIHPSTFEFLFESDLCISYAKDKNNLYDCRGAKKGIDGASFFVLNDYWGKDKNFVYCFKTDRIIKNLDATTFKVTGHHGEAEDKNYIFKMIEVTHKGIGLGHKVIKKFKK